MNREINIQNVQQMNRGLTYAEACFETFRVIDGDVFAWTYHWQRLCLGLQSFGIVVAGDWEEKVYKQCLTCAQDTAPDCLVRLTISGGDASWGLIHTAEPSAYIQAMPFQNEHHALHAFSVNYPFPLHEKTAKYTADYAETLRAIQVWKSGNEVVDPQQSVVCKDGYIISGLTSNILLYQQGKWLTPDGPSILKGTIRQFLLQKSLIQTQTCPTSLLNTCEAMLLINSGQFLREIHSINQRKLTSNHPAIAPVKEALTNEKGIVFTSV